MFACVVANLLVFVPILITAQQVPVKWTPEDFPNPIEDARLCGHDATDSAYICDPNKIIGNDIVHINWILKDAAYNSTKCPCSNYYCENQDGKVPLGYRIGVALVKQMVIQASIDGSPNSKEDQAHLFAYRLKNSKWNMGRCQEDIVIFYSLEDKVLAIYGGSTAVLKLTPYYRDLLAYKVGGRFNEGLITEGLNNLLVDLKLVLNCDNPSTDCGLHEIRNGVSEAVVSVSLTLLTIFISMYCSTIRH